MEEPKDQVLRAARVARWTNIGFTIEDFTRVDRYKHALYTVRMNGTHLTQLVPYRFNVCECGNDWAPNGMRIVTSDHVGNTPEPPSNLFTIRPDRTGLRYLTHYRAASPDAIVGAGSFSPDGRWIVFKHANTPEERYVMWKVHPDGSHLTRIRRFKFNFFGRDWGARAS